MEGRVWWSLLQRSVGDGLRRRRSFLRALAKAFSRLSLLDKHPNPGTVTEVPEMHEVLRDNMLEAV